MSTSLDDVTEANVNSQGILSPAGYGELPLGGRVSPPPRRYSLDCLTLQHLNRGLRPARVDGVIGGRRPLLVSSATTFSVNL